MRQSTPNQWVIRVLVYILGVFVLSFGVAISILSALGVSPGTALPYVLSNILGAPVSVCVIGVYALLVLVQWLLLGRAFKAVNLLQMVFSAIFGYFVDFALWVIGDIALPSYPGRLAMLGVSVVLLGLGVMLFIEAELVPMPVEGLALALGRRLNKPFPKMKVAVDCTLVSLALVCSLVFLGGLVGIREGTILMACMTGKVVGVFRRPLGPLLQRLCFGVEAPPNELAQEPESAQSPQ